MEVFDFHDGPIRIHHAKVDDCVHFHRHVVARDHILRRHVEHHGSQAHADDPIDGRKHENHAGSLWTRQQFPETEDHAAFVLGENLDGADDIQHHHEQKQQRRRKLHVTTSLCADGQPKAFDGDHADARVFRDWIRCRGLPDLAADRDAPALTGSDGRDRAPGLVNHA